MAKKPSFDLLTATKAERIAHYQKVLGKGVLAVLGAQVVAASVGDRQAAFALRIAPGRGRRPTLSPTQRQQNNQENNRAARIRHNASLVCQKALQWWRAETATFTERARRHATAYDIADVIFRRQTPTLKLAELSYWDTVHRELQVGGQSRRNNSPELNPTGRCDKKHERAQSRPHAISPRKQR